MSHAVHQVEMMDLGKTTVHYAVVEFAHPLSSAKRVRHDHSAALPFDFITRCNNEHMGGRLEIQTNAKSKWQI